MKNLSIFLFFFALPVFAHAQDCALISNYYKVGAQLEFTDYGRDGKVKGMRKQQVVQMVNIHDTLYTMLFTTYINKKGKETDQYTIPLKCHGGNFFIDMHTVVPPQKQMESSSDPDVKIKIISTDQVFPNKMKAGQSLADAALEIKTWMNGIQIIDTKWHMKNRKVEKEESVTTTAGTYDCLKITCDFEYNLLGTHSMACAYWYAPGLGYVKSVSYDKKGNELTRSELTKYTK
jgi:hypothetical protein